MSREELTIRIEKYLDGQLSAEEAQKLELLLVADDAIAKELEFHKTIREGIAAYYERQRLLEKMHQWDGDQSYPIKSKPNRGLWRPVLAAASISLLVTVSGVSLYHLAFTNRIDGNLKKEITKLGREINETSQVATEAKISTEKNEERLNEVMVQPKKVTMAGTAFVLTTDGYLVTNYHIVGGRKKVTLKQNQNESLVFTAEVVATDSLLDFALLRINDKKFDGFAQIPYTISDRHVTLAQKIYTLGYPKNDIVYTEGAISSLTGLRSDTMFYQLNIISAPGSSGSPIINEKGELIGVLASRNAQAEGETYCVKMKYILDHLEQIKAKNKTLEIKTNKRSKLAGKKLPDQVKSIVPYIFIVQ